MAEKELRHCQQHLEQVESALPGGENPQGLMGIGVGTPKTEYWVVVSNIYFLFSPRKFGEMIQFDEHIFEMGWFNHQPENNMKKHEKLLLGPLKRSEKEIR